MANPEHLEILEKGVFTWNKWRYANPESKPDLCGAELATVDLRAVDICEVDWSDEYRNSVWRRVEKL